MSVLIKDMEMPKCCEECVAGAYEYNDNDERCFVCGFIKSQHPWECEHVEIDGIDTTKARADFCPLIEVPTPHGELVDRGILMDTYVDRLAAVAERYSPDSSECGILSGAMKLLAIMPTIIEAEMEVTT